MKYNKVTPEIVEELRRIVGDRNVIYDDSEALEAYSHDEVAEKEYAHMPDVVVKPTSTEQISEIMKLANRYMIPVTPRGAGSGLSGGAVPACGGMVLSVEKMNRILEIDTKNLMAVVEPGVVTNEINNAIKDYGLFYAGYPMSVETCYIGGNVAENAGGGKAIKYGVTSRYIMGLEIVTPEGDIINLGGKRVKDVTGYDLLHLMVGSEGTLGIFTKIIVKLQPMPVAKADLLVLFNSVKEAIDIVPIIMTNGKIIPTSIEFMDELSFKTSCEYLNEHLPYQNAKAMLLIELDGDSMDIIESQYETIGELCMKNSAIEVYVADNATTIERVWRIRRNIAEAWKLVSPHQSLEDVVVPVSEIPAFMEKLEQLQKKYNVSIPCYGHAGDGNLHATAVKNPDWTLEEWYDTLHKLLPEMYEIVGKLGGTISGEHGIGHKRKDYMYLVLGDKEIELMKKIKKAFDPNMILNPGKLFNVE
ncbi:MAG: FAD-linked oxidase C-terminal domain-containing protein [Thermoanaerobacteraceae bacterium]|nr:FAD-linked oxidase C-terminal domain-containing protein [Thermoanaerobacteraceae bacterium]